MRIFLMSSFVVLLLTACSGAAETPESIQTALPDIQTALPDVATAIVSEEQPGDIINALPTDIAAVIPTVTEDTLIKFVSSGGIAGFETVTAIDLDGMVTVSQMRGATEIANGTTVLDATQLTELSTLLSGADFAQLESSYMPTQTIADGMSYSIQTPGGTIDVGEGADLPPILNQVLEYLKTVQAEGLQ